jgi:NAD(P)-dependent dehydrogenase (short-subunit alcohol dehydrogenase family)
VPPRLTLVTGVGRAGQVGEAVATAFAARGDRVLLVNRGRDAVQERAAELRSAGHDALAYACDLSDGQAVAELAAQVAREHGGALDALVNVAGGFAMSGPVAESDPDIWTHMASINLDTAYHATRAFLPQVRQRRGAIVYFASEAALPGATGANMWAYAAAKGAVLAMMRAVAREERDAGVRANAVAPTTIRTATNELALGASAQYVEREAVADAVWYLCSDAARGVTGQTIRLA